MRLSTVMGLIAPILVLAWLAGNSSSPKHGAGVLVSEVPQQINLSNPIPWVHGDFRLTPRADFELEARVLSTARYRFDAESVLSPVDFALGWQRMSDSEVLQNIDISQRGRFFYWYSRELPIPIQEIIRSSANMHMIPANSEVERELLSIPRDAVVRIRGRLVDVDHVSRNWRWRTSMTRTDTGAGACEIVWVEYIQRIL